MQWSIGSNLNYFNNLPSEIILYIMNFLPYKNRLVFILINTICYNIFKQNNYVIVSPHFKLINATEIINELEFILKRNVGNNKVYLKFNCKRGSVYNDDFFQKTAQLIIIYNIIIKSLILYNCHKVRTKGLQAMAKRL